MLCLLALRDADARNFLLTQDWREVVAETPGARCWPGFWRADLRPDDPASLNALHVVTSDPAEESLVSAWLLQKMPPNAETVARDWWQRTASAGLAPRLQAAESRLKLPQLSAGESRRAQKQIVDLRGQLDDFSRFSPARVLES